MDKFKKILSNRWGLASLIYCAVFLLVAIVSSINECADVGGFWTVAREAGFIRTWIELNYLILPNAIIYSAFITGAIFLFERLIKGISNDIADNHLGRCPKCQKLRAMKLYSKDLMGTEDISVLVELKDKNKFGDVTGTHEQYIPGERKHYELRYRCKYCGHEYIRQDSEVKKHI